jgi:hypothetical protein
LVKTKLGATVKVLFPTQENLNFHRCFIAHAMPEAAALPEWTVSS